jgi:hypothetical protein
MTLNLEQLEAEAAKQADEAVERSCNLSGDPEVCREMLKGAFLRGVIYGIEYGRKVVAEL